jgi:hypothetical protein
VEGPVIGEAGFDGIEALPVTASGRGWPGWARGLLGLMLPERGKGEGQGLGAEPGSGGIGAVLGPIGGMDQVNAHQRGNQAGSQNGEADVPAPGKTWARVGRGTGEPMHGGIIGETDGAANGKEGEARRMEQGDRSGEGTEGAC